MSIRLIAALALLCIVGGGTIIGPELAVRAPPDGYTVMLANITLALNPGPHAKLPYDTVKDLTPIILPTSRNTPR